MALNTTEVGRDRDYAIGRRIRQRREDLGLSRREVVDRVEARTGFELHGQRLAELERGSGVDVTRILLMAVALDCTATYLMGGTDDPGENTPALSPQDYATRVWLNPAA